MSGFAFEDLPAGRVVDLGEVRVDRDEMVRFAERFDPQPFHVDEEAAKESLLGGLCASGWYTSSLWMRAYVDHVLNGSTAQGSPGISELSWNAPVFPDDVLRFSVRIDDQRESKSRPGLGVISLTGRAERDDELVMQFSCVTLFGKRAA